MAITTRSNTRARIQGLSWLVPNIERAVLGSLLVVVAALFLPAGQTRFTLPKLVAFEISLTILVLLWATRAYGRDTHSVPWMVSAPLSALAVWWVITTLTSVDVSASLYGAPGRYNGAITHGACLGLFFVVASSRATRDHIEKLIEVMVATLVVLGLWALGQYAGFLPNDMSGDAQLVATAVRQVRPVATIGHPVILAAMLGLGAPFLFFFLIESKSFPSRLTWTIALVVVISASFSTMSRGPMIGMGVGMAVVIVAALRERQKSVRPAVLLTSAAVVVALGFLVASNPAGGRRLLDRATAISHLKLDGSAENRFVFFDAALRMIRDRPIVGAGFESFGLLYPRYRSVEGAGMPVDTIPTMVHDGYLQLAQSTGIPGLVLYGLFVAGVLVLVGRRYREAVDIRTRLLCAAFAGSIGSYLIQDLSGWMEIPLSVCFWTVLGLAALLASPDVSADHTDGGGPWPWWTHMVAGFAAATLVFSTVGLTSELRADQLLTRAESLHVRRDWTAMHASLERVVELTGDNPHYLDASALLYLNRVVAEADRDAYQQAASLLDRAHSRNVFDPYILVHRLDLERVALATRLIEAPSPHAEEAARIVAAMDGDNPSVQAAIAGFRFAARNDDPSALESIVLARRLRPGVARYELLERNIRRSLGSTHE